jgi:hypothetical protein
MRYEDRVGEVFGRLTLLSVIRMVGETVTGTFKCNCGKVVNRAMGNVVSGNTSSCGCLKSELTTAKNNKHSLSKTVEYKLWTGMLTRCHNESHSSYKGYGARGITVCDRWRSSFMSFLNDMGKRPSDGHSIERKDNSRGYSEDNCVWATDVEQARNKTTSIYYTHEGESKTLKEWSNEAGVDYHCAYYRHRHGWSIERILSPSDKTKVTV